MRATCISNTHWGLEECCWCQIQHSKTLLGYFTVKLGCQKSNIRCRGTDLESQHAYKQLYEVWCIIFVTSKSSTFNLSSTLFRLGMSKAPYSYDSYYEENCEWLNSISLILGISGSAHSLVYKAFAIWANIIRKSFGWVAQNRTHTTHIKVSSSYHTSKYTGAS